MSVSAAPSQVLLVAGVDRAAGAPSERSPPGRALDLHEGISDPPTKERYSDPRQGCPRWPAGLLLRWRSGDLVGYVEGRCRATNLCPYCRILAVVETAEMLSLDAAEWAPTLWIVLTAREHLARPDTYRHLEQLRRSLRKRWPGIEWFVQVEFQKRGALHLNLLVKGVPIEDAAELLEHASGIWCSRVDALPVGQHVEEMSSAHAVTRYLQKELVHGLKREQAPPLGWRGHRTSQTRGYLVRPASVMRVEARAALAYKRKLHQVITAAPELDAETVAEVVQELVARADARAWDLMATSPHRAEQLLAGLCTPPAPRGDCSPGARPHRLGPPSP